MQSYDLNRLPTVVMTGKFPQKRGMNHGDRILDVNLLVFFHSGACTFVTDGKKYNYRAGDIAIVPKGSAYSTYSDMGCECTFFHFDGEIAAECPFIREPAASELFYGKMKTPNRIIPLDNKIELNKNLSKIELLLSECTSIPYKSNSKAQLFLSLRFSEILLYASEDACHDTAVSHAIPPIAQKISTYINENYREKISLTELSSEIGASPQYCMRAFKNAFGTTIQQYALSLKMNHAKYLLKWTYMNVSEVSDYLGFSSSGYFSRVFKSYYGASPAHCQTK